MKQFFGFELRRFFRKKILLILAAAAIGLLVLNLWTYDFMFSDVGMVGAEMMGAMMPTLSAQYGMTGALTNASFSTILAVLVVLYLCADHSDGTLKNVIARGYGRMPVFGIKFVVCLIGALALAVLCWLAGLLTGGLLWGFEGEWTSQVFAGFGVQAVSILAYTALYFVICCVFKNIGGSLAMSLVVQLVPSLVLELLDLFMTDKDFMFMDFWIEGGMAVTGDTAAGDLTRIALVSSTYAIVFLVLGLLAVRKREV